MEGHGQEIIQGWQDSPGGMRLDGDADLGREYLQTLRWALLWEIRCVGLKLSGDGLGSRFGRLSVHTRGSCNCGYG